MIAKQVNMFLGHPSRLPFSQVAPGCPCSRIDFITFGLCFRLNSQLGVVGLPTLLFFKNGKVILRFNTTITVDNVADFISYHTGEPCVGQPGIVCEKPFD